MDAPKIIFLTFAILLVPFHSYAAIHTELVPYKHGETELEGFLAYDDTLPGKRPGVLVFHEWKGLNDYAKRRATMLAELGYAAFAADMYGKGVRAETHEEAAKLSGLYREDRALMRSRAHAALDFLRSNERTDGGRIAAIGYCFGGTTVLEMARAGFDLKAAVSFHGGLGTPMPAEPGKIKAKILVLHGAADEFVNAEVPAFREEMRNAGADLHFESFDGAVHSFTVPEAGNDPSKGMAYNEDADRRSWQMMEAFLAEVLK
ncbi:MAG: dienelactone hydrolase family protein [Candidatus Omnitrophica bacterium]|nr:dienelactone hydrolase family protein [Candidatus Omnitrophota bacterium]